MRSHHSHRPCHVLIFLVMSSQNIDMHTGDERYTYQCFPYHHKRGALPPPMSGREHQSDYPTLSIAEWLYLQMKRNSFKHLHLLFSLLHSRQHIPTQACLRKHCPSPSHFIVERPGTHPNLSFGPGAESRAWPACT